MPFNPKLDREAKNMNQLQPNIPLDAPGPPPILRREADGRLLLARDGQNIPVALRPCFPWSHPRNFLSVRDDKGNEAAVIQDLNDLDETSRQAVEAALETARFTFEILKIEEIERDFDLRVWKVLTRQGPRIFLLKLADWPYELDDGTLVITDLSGDSYRIPDPDALDKHSVKLLYPYRK